MLTRRGFTLVELLIALALLGTLLAAIVGLIVSQQRFYLGASSMLETRAILRDAGDALGASLRGVAPREGDVYAMTATSIDFREPTGASIVCTVAAGRTRVTIPALALASGLIFTSWPVAPSAGDSVWIFDRGALADTVDDVWRIAALVTAPAAGSCPVASGFSTTAAESVRGFTLSLDRALPATVSPGAAIRFFRRARYELYAAGDGSWHLGYSDCLSSRATPCSTVQPVSGPYLPGTGSPPGLALSYFDAAGAVTTDVRAVARVDLRSRGESRTVVDGATRRDSLVVSIHPRS